MSSFLLYRVSRNSCAIFRKQAQDIKISEKFLIKVCLKISNFTSICLLVTWRCANIAFRFNRQIYLKKLILSFNKILLLSIRHKQRCGFTAEFTIVLVSQKNKITKKMKVVYTISELESSTGCICGNISVLMVRFIVRTNSIVKVYICVCKTL